MACVEPIGRDMQLGVITRIPQSPDVLTNEASRDSANHKTRSDNEHQTEIPLMGEIEIPRRSFLVNEQVDVYYIFLLSLSITCNHVYLQTRNSKNITGNSITKHRMSMSIELLVGYSPFKWHSVWAPSPCIILLNTHFYQRKQQKQKLQHNSNVTKNPLRWEYFC